jgi:hypothetical protein
MPHVAWGKKWVAYPLARHPPILAVFGYRIALSVAQPQNLSSSRPAPALQGLVHRAVSSVGGKPISAFPARFVVRPAAETFFSHSQCSLKTKGLPDGRLVLALILTWDRRGGSGAPVHSIRCSSLGEYCSCRPIRPARVGVFRACVMKKAVPGEGPGHWFFLN